MGVRARAPIEPPANDTCAGAVTLQAGDAKNGSTVNAIDDYGASLGSSCSGAGAAFVGPDVVYQFTPSASGLYAVSLMKSGAWDSALWVAQGTCAEVGEACVAAANASWNKPGEQLTWNATAGIPYIIVVDGVNRIDAGDFVLRLNAAF
jgi:hypothetical protein